ncbi:MAG: hypothetical protein HDT09_02760 [Bacteroidales bacterium]|nr:hypothetical protein [Bacteroidales bacterium]
MKLSERYQQVKKPRRPETPDKAWVRKVAEVTKNGELTVRRRLAGEAEPAALTKEELTKHFGSTTEKLFPAQGRTISKKKAQEHQGLERAPKGRAKKGRKQRWGNIWRREPRSDITYIRKSRKTGERSLLKKRKSTGVFAARPFMEETKNSVAPAITQQISDSVVEHMQKIARKYGCK